MPARAPAQDAKAYKTEEITKEYAGARASPRHIGIQNRRNNKRVCRLALSAQSDAVYEAKSMIKAK